MDKFSVEKTPILDLLIIEPKVFGDYRGFFVETYNKKQFLDLGINVDFIVDGHSKSRKGVLRGLHFQAKHPQSKIVRSVQGKVYDVAVDLRRGSPTFGKYFGLILSEENKKMLYIPNGFVHGFLTLSSYAEILYKFTDYHYPEHDSGIIWNDPDIGIDWPFADYNIHRKIVSEKDQKLPKLSEIETPFTY
ncbi:MAG: dTDP-4-dehydrorhamnose 3,5-epimerase [Candidatus Thorarchaeota archaeon]